MTGWLIIAANLVGNVAAVVALAPSVLAIFSSTEGSTWPDIGISTGLAAVMIAVAVLGIRLTARVQVSMAVIEYSIMVVLAFIAMAAWLGHHAGTFPPARSWLSVTGIGGQGSLAAGLLLAVFMFVGWDATVYVNEEVKHRRENPGRAAMLAVLLLAVFYTFTTVALQGAVTPGALQANGAAPLVYIGQVLGGGALAKVVALSLALSVIAGVGTGIIVLARIVYGMASYQALPSFLATVNRRTSTPAIATIVCGAVFIAATWAYLLSSTSIQAIFSDLIATTGLLFTSFYILTALAAIVYFRHRITSSLKDMVSLGILPVAAMLFLGWVIFKQLQTASGAEIWALAGIAILGLILMLGARFIAGSPFFAIPREKDQPAT